VDFDLLTLSHRSADGQAIREVLQADVLKRDVLEGEINITLRAPLDPQTKIVATLGNSTSQRLLTDILDEEGFSYEISPGTFTISNGGVFGSLLSTPILNPPQSGIGEARRPWLSPWPEGPTSCVFTMPRR